VLKTPIDDITLTDGSKYIGQADATTKSIPHGFGVYTTVIKGGVTTTYMGQWVDGIPSGWGVAIQ